MNTPTITIQSGTVTLGAILAGAGLLLAGVAVFWARTADSVTHLVRRSSSEHQRHRTAAWLAKAALEGRPVLSLKVPFGRVLVVRNVRPTMETDLHEALAHQALAPVADQIASERQPGEAA